MRLEAKRKEQKRRQLLRRGATVVAVAAVVLVSVLLITRGSPSPPTTTTTTTSTLPQHKVTAAEIAAINVENQRLKGIITIEELAAIAHRAALQAHANRVAVAAGCPKSTSSRANTLTFAKAPRMTITKTASYRAVISTTAGKFTVTLDPKTAPISVNNFVFLARHGFYNCVIFHRVIPLFMNQTGDPTGTGAGGPGYTIPNENPQAASNSLYQYPPGSVAMANTGAPHSGGSQFFIVTGTGGENLPASYALFGHVTSGLNVAATINGMGNANRNANGVPPIVTNRILSIKIIGP